MQTDPAAVLHLQRGDALRAAGCFDEARTSYLQAIQVQPTLAKAHVRLGLLHWAQKRVPEALLALEQAVALEPANVSYWKLLAESYTDWADFGQAVRCWLRVLALQPDRPALHLGLSATLLEAGRLGEAEEQIRAALRLQPDSAAAHYGLGDLYEQLGDKVQAEAAFRAALSLLPAFTLAQVRLARLLRGRLPDADRAGIEERLADPRLPIQGRVPLLFALAAVYDARGDYGRAAVCARQANALSLDESRRRGVRYFPEQHRRFVDGLLQVFGPDFFKRTAGAGLASQRPVFIVGLPRSGTSLVEQILASHSRVFGAGELRFGPQSLRAIPAALGRTDDPLACVPALDTAAIGRLGERHLARLAVLDGGRADRITDKLPHNYQYLGLLATLFPQATFIHCRRDLRDVAVSCWLTDFQLLEWTNDVGHVAARFQDYTRLMKHWPTVLPVTLHDVVYEEIVADLEGGARRLVAACGLEWEPACLEFHRTRRPVRTASSVQVRTPIYSESVGRWKHYERELADLFAQLCV